MSKLKNIYRKKNIYTKDNFTNIKYNKKWKKKKKKMYLYILYRVNFNNW